MHFSKYLINVTISMNNKVNTDVYKHVGTSVKIRVNALSSGHQFAAKSVPM